MLVEFLNCQFLLHFIEGACQLILHTDIHSIRCTAVILQGNDALRHWDGTQEFDILEIDFHFDNSATDSDFRVLRGLADGQTHTIKVTLPDGTEATSAGVMSVWIGGFGVNAIIPAKLSVALSQDWAYKDPA